MKELFDEVVNHQNSKEYLISTAKNPYDIWETMVVKKPPISLSAIKSETELATEVFQNVIKECNDPLIVENAHSEKAAQEMHGIIKKIVSDRPLSEWQKSYKKVTNIDNFQQIVIEEDLENNKDK